MTGDLSFKKLQKLSETLNETELRQVLLVLCCCASYEIVTWRKMNDAFKTLQLSEVQKALAESIIPDVIAGLKILEGCTHQ